VKGFANHLSRTHTLTVLISPNRDSRRSSNINSNEEIGIFSIGGHELCDGPFYNFARCGTWSYIANKVIEGYASALSAERASYSTVTITSASGVINDAIELVDARPYENINPAPNGFEDNQRLLQQAPQTGFGNRSLDLRYAGPVIKCDFEHTGPMPRFGWQVDRHLSKLRTQIRATKALAFGLALALQMITGWSAFMIAYNTPTIGIGCRSFVYMTYTLISTFCCILLILASEFSDTECYRREADKMRREGQNPTIKPSAFLATAAICCRFAGEILAILNSMLVVMSCIFEFSGVYQSCFCKSSHIGLGSKAYVSFLSTEESVQIARIYWIAGAGVPMFAVVVISIGYFELSREK
jgi:hypothetical protein